MRDHDRVVVLLRGQNPDALPEAQAVEQNLVGVDVELLLGLTLDIDDAFAPQDIGQPCPCTWAWIILVASVMPESSQENSPDAPGKRFCS